MSACTAAVNLQEDSHMVKIDFTINNEGLEHNISNARKNGIIIPTIAQMQDPDKIPEKIREKLKDVGLWEVNPLNLFRISCQVSSLCRQVFSQVSSGCDPFLSSFHFWRQQPA